MHRDPIEQTQEYADAIKKIQPLLDEFSKELEEQGNVMGSCHKYWAKKQELLKSMGIAWKTPAELNPYVIFD